MPRPRVTPLIRAVPSRPRPMRHAVMSRRLAGGPVRLVTFPATDLTFRVMIALGADPTASWLTWQWEDITRFVRYADGITTTAGGRDESSTVTPGRTTLTLDNRDGRFCRRNPTGPYYRLLSRNTPIWVQVDAGSGFRTRVQHFVNEWPTRWDKSGNDCYVPIVCSGIMRRQGQGTAAASAVRQTVEATDPVAWWPLEDGTDATLGSSGIPGGYPMRQRGALPAFGADGLGVGTASAVDLSTGGGLGGQVAPATVTAWSFALLANFTSVGPPLSEFLLKLNGGGWETVLYTSLDSYTVAFYVGGVGVASLDGPVADDGTTHDVAVTLQQSGANVAISLVVDGVTQDSDTIVSQTVSLPTAVQLNPFGDASAAGPQVGHIRIYDSVYSGDLSDAAAGYVGEDAKTRIARICAERSWPFLAGGGNSSQRLGPQPFTTPFGVVHDAENTDRGVVYEAEFGLAYQARTERHNAPVGLTLDFDDGQVADAPQPADDDQRTRNRFTAARSDGASATVEDSDSVTVDGEYDDSGTFNPYTDEQLANIAGWRVHQGTVDEDRWPALPINLARSPELIDAWTSLGFGARLNATSPPDQAAPDPIDAFIEGTAERMWPKMWRAGVNTSPASAFDVFRVEGGGNRGRLAPAASTLAADATSGATTISVATPGVLWVTGAVNFDINVAGERMTVTSISGASSPQTFTVTRSVNGVIKEQPASVGGAATKVKLWRGPVVAL